MPLSAIWASENGPMAEQFILKWDNSPSPPGPLKFCVKDGAVRAFLTSICTLTDGPEKLFVLQLLPQTAAAPAPASPKEASAESLAHKQKLDCALQLARTVSLDFNNALTSILGHASLLLTQAEPNHPWRRSLMEVEKSAARAAEIANDLGTFSRHGKGTTRAIRPQYEFHPAARGGAVFQCRGQKDHVECCSSNGGLTRRNLTRPKSSRHS